MGENAELAERLLQVAFEEPPPPREPLLPAGTEGTRPGAAGGVQGVPKHARGATAQNRFTRPSLRGCLPACPHMCASCACRLAVWLSGCLAAGASPAGSPMRRNTSSKSADSEVRRRPTAPQQQQQQQVHEEPNGQREGQQLEPNGQPQAEQAKQQQEQVEHQQGQEEQDQAEQREQQEEHQQEEQKREQQEEEDGGLGNGSSSADGSEAPLLQQRATEEGGAGSGASSTPAVPGSRCSSQDQRTAPCAVCLCDSCPSCT